jgi:hypothetical protein
MSTTELYNLYVEGNYHHSQILEVEGHYGELPDKIKTEYDEMWWIRASEDEKMECEK